MRKLLAIVFAAACLASFACGGRQTETGRVADEPSTQSTPARGGTARVGLLKEPATFIDWNARTEVDLTVADLVFRRLARPGAEPATFVPDLAESWELSPDGRTLRFRLRRGVTWEDGHQVTSRDVFFSQKYADTKGLVEVEAEGEHEVLFHFRRADEDILAHAVGGHVYPAHILGSVTEEDLATHSFNRRPVGSGPFRLERWEAGQYLLFERREETPEEDLPYLDRVVVRIFQDKSAAYRELEGGGLDYLRKIQREVYDRLVASERAQGFRFPSREFIYVAWNSRRSPLDRIEVRQAMTALVNRTAVASRFEGQEAPTCEGPVPPGDPRHDPALTSPAFDPGGAEGRLLAAGLRRSPDGKWTREDGAPFRVRLLCLSGNPLFRDVTSVVADDLRRAGIDAEVRALELPRFLERMESGEFEGMLLTRPAVLPVNLKSCFSADGAENYGKLHDPELDGLLDAAAEEPDPERARVAFHDAYRRIVEIQPWTFLYYRSDSILYHPRLRGLAANPRDPIAFIDEWWIPKNRQ